MNTRIAISIVTIFLLLAAVAVAQQPNPPAAALMKSSIIPMSTVIFDVGKTPPKTDKDWTAVQNAATAVSAAGKQLMTIGPADNTNWMKFTKDMIDASDAALKGAKAKKVNDVLDAGDLLYGSCDDCHKQYMKK